MSDYNVKVLASTGMFTSVVKACSKPSPSGYVTVTTHLGHRASYRLRYDREYDLVYPGSRVRYRLVEKFLEHIGDETKSFNKTEYSDLEIMSEPVGSTTKYSQARALTSIPKEIGIAAFAHLLAGLPKKISDTALEECAAKAMGIATHAAKSLDLSWLDSPLRGESADQLEYDPEDPGTPISNSEKTVILPAQNSNENQ